MNMSKILAQTKILSAIAFFVAIMFLRSPAHAQSAPEHAAPSPEQLIEALKTKGTRGAAPAVTPAETARAEQQDKIIQRLKAKATRGLSVGEREELAQVVSDRPAFDLEVNFDLNSADIAARAKPVVTSLGSALQNSALKGSTFLVAGHTDATGSPEYNQKLSEERARSVKDFLVKNFNLSEENLVVVGYGQEKLKNPRVPSAGENRRVQVVNISPTVASAGK
jgi:outer membrane protein OmpA-like peptidoglycan-associated protein